MKKNTSNFINKENLLPFILLTSLFLLWGLANNMTDTLLAAFKRIMSMEDFKTSWIQFAFYGSYFCLAFPAAMLIKKYSYKSGVLLGLGLFALGALLFYPASLTMKYGHFLFALFVLAGGLSILETSANPYIIALGSDESATKRLNLAQSFNPIGSIFGVLLSKLFILSQLNKADALERRLMTSDQLEMIQAKELSAVMGPYVGVALILVVIWIIIRFSKMPQASDSDKHLNIMSTIKKLLKTPHYTWGVVAQFFYVGAQICVWSFTIRYVMQELNLNEADASSYYLLALILFAGSRFVFTGLMSFVSPRQLLLFSAGMAMVSSFIVVFASGYLAVYALVSISGFMSLMFPTIFGLGVKGLGNDTKIAGSGMIMAILGGAVLPGVQGQVSDFTNSIHLSYLVPMLCFLVIIFYAAKATRPEGRFIEKDKEMAIH